MNPWGYKNYLDSVCRDMKTGMDQMGFDPIQSFGYAHNELAFRLEEFPGELPFALIALAVSLLEHGSLNELDREHGFIPELLENVEKQTIERIVKGLSQDDLSRFEADLEKVRLELESLV